MVLLRRILPWEYHGIAWILNYPLYLY